MNRNLLFVLLLAGIPTARSQSLFSPDTILFQTFTVDPSDTMLPFPSGNDIQWVNWDADNLGTLCGNNQAVPGSWYWESDLGETQEPPENFAFTSCSYLEDFNEANENWLITPPVDVSDSFAVLSWRSLAFEGPGYLDGYKVLVSTDGNEPFAGDFQDTLFVAAEMLDYNVPESLDPDDYLFSPGYIHANRYTDTNYFFLITPNAGAYTGRLEPHRVSLEAYAGKTIYIAFLHDSTDDSILQLDDIAVYEDPTFTSISSQALDRFFFRVRPNPATTTARLSWQLPADYGGHFVLSDMLGNILLKHSIGGGGARDLDIRHFPPGMYACTMRTPSGSHSVLLVKQ